MGNISLDYRASSLLSTYFSLRLLNTIVLIMGLIISSIIKTWFMFHLTLKVFIPLFNISTF